MTALLARAPDSPTYHGIAAVLADPRAYPHPVEQVEVIETHISWVFLAGEYAYKVKKPLRLAFLDYSTVAAREHFCREELRLNRRAAPEIYLDVVAIAGEPARVGGPGEPVEWAVRMRRFPQESLLERLARRSALQPCHIDDLAETVAALHAAAPVAEGDSAHGTAQAVRGPAESNFVELAALFPAYALRDRLEALRAWTSAAGAALAPAFERRKALGFVRECHGDLHLGNVVLLRDGPKPFDCIEFDAALRFTDAMADVAFLFMDLVAHGAPGLAYRFLDRYLQASGDYEGVEVLRFYAVYRAVVRAKIACLRRAQARDPAARAAAWDECEQLLALALRLTHREPALLVLMHGLSASGKTAVSQRLLEALGAIRLRSDVERKRMHRLEASVRARAAPGEGIYSADSTDATYARLEYLAHAVLASGYAVIVDATFLDVRRRKSFAAVARAAAARFAIVSCHAPVEVLRSRIERRLQEGADASDADAEVLARQAASAEPLDAEELAHTMALDTTTAGLWRCNVDLFARHHHLPLPA